MNFFRQLFVWWHGETFGTRLWTLLLGKRVGKDAAGNIYYRHRQRETHRWVIYNGIVDASKVPPDWHAWLHNMVRQPPRAEEDEKASTWLKSHRANLTGTTQSYLREPASLPNEDQPVEYEAWRPNQTTPSDKDSQ